MPYPTINQYQSVLRLPPGQRPFKSPDLDRLNFGSILPPANSLFLHWGAGRFAAVYRSCDTNNQHVALRCLLSSPPSDLADRYIELERHRSAYSLPFLVSAQYVPDAIQVQGIWLPMFLMDWVPGRTLGAKAAELASNGDRNSLQRLAEKWQNLVEAMQDTQFAHGDLQDGNVMVSDRGELCLVDYDTLYVPRLVGRGATAVGTQGYVHPDYLRAGARPYSENMDTFGALVILLSLRALAHDPGLHGQFSKENLLLEAADLEDATNSVAFAALFATNTPSVTSLAYHLVNMCRNVSHGDVTLRTLLTQDVSSKYTIKYSPLVVAQPKHTPSPSIKVVVGQPAHPNNLVLSPWSRKHWKVTSAIASVAVTLIAGTWFMHSALLSPVKPVIKVDSSIAAANFPHPITDSKNHNNTTEMFQTTGLSPSIGGMPTNKLQNYSDQKPFGDTPIQTKPKSVQSVDQAIAARIKVNQVITHLLEIQDKQQRSELSREQANKERVQIRNGCQEALEDADRAIHLDRQDKEAWLQHARALYYLGEYKVANEDLKYAMASFKENSDFQPLEVLVSHKLHETGQQP